MIPSLFGWHPASPYYLEQDTFLKIVQCIYCFLQGQWLLCPAFPNCSIYGSNYQVVVTNDLWIFLSEERYQKMLHIVLMSDKQITVGTVAARLVQREQLHWIYMDNQWQLTLLRLVFTLWASRKSHVFIRIEKEAVEWGLFTQLGLGLLFPTGHW